MKQILIMIIAGFFLIQKMYAQTYNCYFGNIHSQTSYSDGNKDSSTSGMSTPLQAFNYARASQHIDFYGISDHNHASAGMKSAVYYHKGLADANTANSDGSFVAMYGMEYGVISGGGHVIVYGSQNLFGWDTNDYDVFNSEFDYAGLFAKIAAIPNAFGYLCHPQSGDYTNLVSTAAYNAVADSAIVGMPARSGPAFSTNTTYSNPSTSTYISQFQAALAKGYHVGIGLDHDTHNSVFGRQTAGRLVVLAPSLTRANVYDAFRHRRFYASDDWNAAVDFNIQSKPMGSVFAHAGNPTLNITVSDPDHESISSIQIYYGVPGSGSTCTLLSSNSGATTFSYTPTIANNSMYYYYAQITQTDGDIIWTSPIWYTRNDNVLTGVENDPTNGTFTVFPNPTGGAFDLSFEFAGKETCTVELTNMLGQKLETINPEAFSGQYTRHFDLSAFSKGLYLISLKTTTGYIVKKVVVD
jgi:hypothetical protein